MDMVTEQKTSLLMVIVKKQNLWKRVDGLKQKLNTPQFIVLKTDDVQYQDFFFLIYETQLNNLTEDFKFTVVHKKGKCYYTINALNALVMELNDGQIDKDYEIDWQQYQNKILFLNRDRQFIKIPTKLYKIIKN